MTIRVRSMIMMRD